MGTLDIGDIRRRVRESDCVDELELEKFRLGNSIPYIRGDSSITCGGWMGPRSCDGKWEPRFALRVLYSVS